MPDNKLTDNEIIKALECSVKSKCHECPYFQGYPCGKCRIMRRDVLDLINRLQAENKRLIGDVTTYRLRWAKAESRETKAKSEAYKEFVEKLCEGRVSNDNTVILAKCLLKELVGEDK